MADAGIIKELRDQTGLSFDKIKKALDEAGGDRDKALALLQNSYGAAAAAKAGREATEGLITSYVHSNGKIGALLTLACETDFVARNEAFGTLAHDLALHAGAMRPLDATEMLSQPFVKDPSVTVQDVINQAIAKLGENIKLTQVAIQVIG